MKTVRIAGGNPLPALGVGTWRLGESTRTRALEVSAVRTALELGYRVIDTAEMYGEGGAEEVVGRALGDAVRAGTLTRDEVFVVSKVYPHNASREGALAACERSCKRLGLDTIDLYLLHWRGSHPLRDSVAAFRELRERGRIHHWGVSNFDVDDMIELYDLDGGDECATNQVYYSLTERGPEFALLAWQRRHGVPAMAYSPIDQGQRATDKSLRALASVRGIQPAQLALAWVLSRPDVMAIPKAVTTSHLRENLAAAEVALTAEELAELDRLFPPPTRKSPLAMR